MSNADASTKRDTVRKPKVYIDSDVPLAAAASPEGTSHIIIKLSELTLIEGVISESAISWRSCLRQCQPIGYSCNQLSYKLNLSLRQNNWLLITGKQIQKT